MCLCSAFSDGLEDKSPRAKAVHEYLRQTEVEVYNAILLLSIHVSPPVINLFFCLRSYYEAYNPPCCWWGLNPWPDESERHLCLACYRRSLTTRSNGPWYRFGFFYWPASSAVFVRITSAVQRCSEVCWGILYFLLKRAATVLIWSLLPFFEHCGCLLCVGWQRSNLTRDVWWPLPTQPRPKPSLRKQFAWNSCIMLENCLEQTNSSMKTRKRFGPERCYRDRPRHRSLWPHLWDLKREGMLVYRVVCFSFVLRFACCCSVFDAVY